jgi:hypothetical protein
MSNNNYPTGEVYGSKVLTFAIIATTIALGFGMLWSPAQHAVQPAKPQNPAEQVVVTAHVPGVSG